MAGEDRRLTLLVAIALALQAALLPILAAPGSGQPVEPYRDYRTLEQDLRELVRQHPDMAEIDGVWSSQLGYTFFVVSVARDQNARSWEQLQDLPTLYVDGGHHGNEPLSVEAAYRFLEDTLQRAAEDPSYLEGRHLLVAPVVNPDGFDRNTRTNNEGVDLDRNYPFHWGRYGASEVPGHPNYRGPSPASEGETEATIGLFEDRNVFAYLSGHAGRSGVVLPWSEDDDGTIPDSPAYDAWLANVEAETGLTALEPTGAGTAPAWAYGNRTALSLGVEVAEERNLPASLEEVQRRVQPALDVYRLTFENLTHLGGEVHVSSATETTVTVHNDGRDPAYRVSADAETIEKLPPGETITLQRAEGEGCLVYERVEINGEEGHLDLRTTPIPREDGQLPACEITPATTPAPSALVVLAAALAGLALARRPRR